MNSVMCINLILIYILHIHELKRSEHGSRCADHGVCTMSPLIDNAEVSSVSHRIWLTDDGYAQRCCVRADLLSSLRFPHDEAISRAIGSYESNMSRLELSVQQIKGKKKTQMFEAVPTVSPRTA